MVDFKFPAKKLDILRAALKLQNEIRIDVFFFACLIFDCYLWQRAILKNFKLRVRI